MYFVCTREEKDYINLRGGSWGYFWHREDALDAVHRNVTDIHEAIYPLAIIECLTPGLFPVPKKREWFGWNDKKTDSMRSVHLSAVNVSRATSRLRWER